MTDKNRPPPPASSQKNYTPPTPLRNPNTNYKPSAPAQPSPPPPPRKP